MIFFFTCCVIIVRYYTKSKNNNQKLADIELNVARLYLFILSLGLFFSCFSFLIFYRNLNSIFLFHLWNIWGISIQRSAEGKHEREDKKRGSFVFQLPCHHVHFFFFHHTQEKQKNKNKQTNELLIIFEEEEKTHTIIQ